MCAILQSQFTSVYSSPVNTCNLEELLTEPGPQCMNDIIFTAEDIKTNIFSIKPTASPGSDGVPALLLRECVDELKTPLYLLWRTSLDEGKLPKCLKESRVIPVFKSGDRSKAPNY